MPQKPSAVAFATATLLGALAASPAFAQDKQIVTFAAASFAEPGRGDKMRAWVAKFNQSQDKVEVQPVAIPFSIFAKHDLHADGRRRRARSGALRPARFLRGR